ncbi:MAG: replication-associated recombination protein A [Actinomyces graevenitzii]|jgi:crossover junction endodeoxyribonuclease ATPase|uniref:Replication-associated recombination protein A n=1 Tax=Actinomyces graevenitzii TaxID=55565 RepID=A0A9E7AJ34_9ACTO|nr:replication-associated recombination protein A [Actinomyces graevenitzii]UQF80486.1 MAG: replication-associated recombination protein A [Actinomyces graevenitzii]
MDLFEAANSDESGLSVDPHAPLAVRMRPRSLDELVGQSHLLTPGSPLRRLIGGGRGATSSVILFGPPGTGKTTLAYLVARAHNRRFVELSAVSAGVKEVRAVVDQARHALSVSGQETVLFIDEVHRFSRSQQDSLLPAVENRWVTLIAATTENPSFSVVAPLLSRSLLLTLQPLDGQDIAALVRRALSDPRGYACRVDIDDDALAQLVRLAGNDARKALTVLEAAAQSLLDGDALVDAGALGDSGAVLDAETVPKAGGATEKQKAQAKQPLDAVKQSKGAKPEVPIITVSTIEQAADIAAVRYDRSGDQHYDVASAFIKSMRGSDVDAAIHYLARMIAAGEDPRFIARRVVIAASEDVGMADPSVLATASAAMSAVAQIGMPEARIILAQAVIAVASAPKSNAAYLAIDRALADVRAGNIGQVPAHLRDAHYAGAQKLGHGTDYKYAHDYPHSVAAQEYLPEELRGKRYYQPTRNGFEDLLTTRLEKVRDLLGRG